jgi:hypothetical protein
MSFEIPVSGRSHFGGIFAAFFLLAATAQAATIQEPYTLASSNGVLNLLMVAEAQPVPTLSHSIRRVSFTTSAFGPRTDRRLARPRPPT